MANSVVSFRLSKTVYEALQESATNSHVSVAEALDWLLCHSFGNRELLRGLRDCPRPWNIKLDTRIPGETSNQLRLAAGELRIPISVYTRRLLYHVFVTKRVFYLKSDGHYTLAVRHD